MRTEETDAVQLFAFERRLRRMPAVDARVADAASAGVDESDLRTVIRATALAELRERQAEWMFRAGDRVWQASLDATAQGDQRALDMCRMSGELRRSAELLRLVLR